MTFRNSQGLGLIAAVGAVILGLVYMGLAGAPHRLPMMNGAALLIGLVMVLLATRLRFSTSQLRGPLLVGLSLCLAATALFGFEVEGAARWASLAGLTVQPSLMVVPVLVTAYAKRPDRLAATALAIAIVAVAAQPDRAVAAMLLAGVGVAAAMHRDRWSIALFGLAAGGVAATLLQPDNLPAVPYVDQILYTAGTVHLLAGVAVWCGTLILFLPALGLKGDTSAATIAMLAVWAAAVIAALLHNYPTPLVGYGASSIIGYLLGLLSLAGPLQSSRYSEAAPSAETSGASDRHLKFA